MNVTPMPCSPSSNDSHHLERTNELIARLNAGDEAAYHELIASNQEWVRRRVRERLGPALRAKVETVDLVQSTMAEALRYRPNLRVAGREQFRALMARIVENVIRGFHDHVRAQCRDAAREEPLASGSVHAAPSRQVAPDELCASMEADERLREALTRLRADDRRVLELRYFQQMAFADIGLELNLSADAARMKCSRAEAKLRDALSE